MKKVNDVLETQAQVGDAEDERPACLHLHVSVTVKDSGTCHFLSTMHTPHHKPGDSLILNNQIYS